MDTVVHPNKNLSLYLQIKAVLIKRIQEKSWAPNSLIPTEHELMKEFNVSRTTIRQSISLLVQEGLLEKRQGKGTVVKPHQLAGSLGILKGFAEEATEKGLVPESKLLRAEFSRDYFTEKSLLQVDGQEKILVIERIRFANKTPIALERSFWPESIGVLLMKEDLEGAKLYEILEKNEIEIKRAKEKISAVNAEIEEADLLGIRGGEALIQMERLSFGGDNKPIEFTATKYCSDRYHYTIELTR